MNFNQLVFEKVVPLFSEQHFQVSELYENFFQFKSVLVEVTISYNELDKTCLFEVGKVGGFLYPINDNALEQVFGSEIKFNQQTKEGFLNSVVIFLKQEGIFILNGELEKLEELKSFIEKESEVYTSKVIKQYNLAALDKAWNNGEYEAFIKLFNQTNKNEFPQSYLIKYKIANQKIK